MGTALRDICARVDVSRDLPAAFGKGDTEGAHRMRARNSKTSTRRSSEVDYRAANVRAGYVYVISRPTMWAKCLA